MGKKIWLSLWNIASASGGGLLEAVWDLSSYLAAQVEEFLLQIDSFLSLGWIIKLRW